MIDQLGGRKSVAIILCLLLAVGAVLLKGDVPSNFKDLLEFLFGAFVLGNVGSKVVAARAGVPEGAGAEPAPSLEAPGPSLDLAPLEEAVARLEEVANLTAGGVNTTNQTLAYIVQKTGLNAR